MTQNYGLADWRFCTPGGYIAEALITDRYKRQTRLQQDIEITYIPLRALTMGVSNEVVRIRENVHFALRYVHAVGDVSFRYHLLRSNGSRVPMYEGANERISWRFNTPDTYTLVGRVTDGLGRAAEYAHRVQVHPIQLPESLPFVSSPRATQAQAVRWARSRNAADWFIREIPTYWRLAKAAGLDPALLISISALETGNGRFVGHLDADFKNPAGIKTTSGEPYPMKTHPTRPVLPALIPGKPASEPLSITLVYMPAYRDIRCRTVISPMT